MNDAFMEKSRTILKATGVRKSYRMGATRVEVLKGVDLTRVRNQYGIPLLQQK